MKRDDLIAGFTAAADAHEGVEALLLGGSLGRGRATPTAMSTSLS
ncbi:hypothetical protein [Phenylobacterium sp.]|nr:hypothetical protein [Phenylobacterium sp.]